MRFVGIDIGADTHVVAAVDETERVLIKPTKIAEDAGGYTRLLELLGEPAHTLVAMEATGHYWKNLFATLVARGFIVALLNPLRTARFAAEELARTKTDAIDALGINWKVGPLSSKVFRFTAPATPGRYAFYCDICCAGKENPSMQGELTVTA